MALTFWWNVEQWNSHTLYEYKMLYNQFGKLLAISYNVKQLLFLYPSNSTTRYLPKRNKNTYSLKKTYARMFIAAIFIIDKNGDNSNVQNIWVHKQIVVYSDYGKGQETFWSDGKFFGVMEVSYFTHNCIHLRSVHFTVCKFYFNFFKRVSIWICTS